MRAFEIAATDAQSRVVTLLTTDTATEALEKLKDALTLYRRAWVVDEVGADVSIDRLSEMARQERGERKPLP